jgi:hypothetical protein
MWSTPMHTYFALSLFLANDSAYAQGPTATRPRLPIDPPGLNDKTIAGTKAAPPAADSAAPLPCDFRMGHQADARQPGSGVQGLPVGWRQHAGERYRRALKSAQDYNKKMAAAGRRRRHGANGDRRRGNERAAFGANPAAPSNLPR